MPHGTTLQTIPHLMAFEVMFGAAVTLLVLLTVVYAYFRRLIRAEFPEAWKEMGAPTFLNQSIAGTWTTFRWLILRAEYRKLSDTKVSALGDAVRLMYFIFMAIFISYVALFFLVRPTP